MSSYGRLWKDGSMERKTSHNPFSCEDRSLLKRKGLTDADLVRYFNL